MSSGRGAQEPAPPARPWPAVARLHARPNPAGVRRACAVLARLLGVDDHPGGCLPAVPRQRSGALQFLRWKLTSSCAAQVAGLRRLVVRATDVVCCRLLLLVLGFFWIPAGSGRKNTVTISKGGSKAPGSWPGRAGAGSVIVASLTSYLDILYLTFRFSPVFAFPIMDPAVPRPAPPEPPARPLAPRAPHGALACAEARGRAAGSPAWRAGRACSGRGRSSPRYATSGATVRRARGRSRTWRRWSRPPSAATSARSCCSQRACRPTGAGSCPSSRPSARRSSVTRPRPHLGSKGPCGASAAAPQRPRRVSRSSSATPLRTSRPPTPSGP